MKRPSVIFVVSTVNLVLQQKQRFETYLSAGIADISSANSNDMPLKHVLRNHEVVIITAQILVNNLDPRNPEGLGLSDITMLIFDECHHANKDHAYNKVMERYLAVKMQPSKRGCRLPQVKSRAGFLNPFNRKSYQCQISPAASSDIPSHSMKNLAFHSLFG